MTQGKIKLIIGITIIFLVASIGLAFVFTQQNTGLNEDEVVFCTMDARQCPDGSFVGRIPPACEFAECPAIDPNDPLLNNEWIWLYTEYSDEEKLEAPVGERFVLSFQNGQVMSTTDCNSLSGSFIRDGQILNFTAFASTLMYCEDSLEGEYSQALGKTNSYLILNNTLQLNLDQDGVMYFERR